MSYQPPQPPSGWGPQGYPPPGYPHQGYPPQPPPKKTSALAIIVAGIVAICGICMVVGAISKNRNSGTPGTTGTTGGDPSQRQYVTQTCADVAHLFGSQSRMSDLQQTELWRQYDGKWARWSVTAGEVSETFGQLQVQFKCGTESLLFDGHAYFGDDQRARLLGVQPGATIQIEGRLEDHGRLLGLSLRDATLTGP